MHGREGEERKRRRHMWPVPVLGTTTVTADSTTSPADYFCKDGRKISVGDCALFKPPQDSPPFIGLIRSLTSGKEDNLKLSVNWLYRPSEVKLGKGLFLEAAPNEVFYSFHKDEIPAASLLHPCKVAFLRKGVELPSGISSFVCRRVYDIASKCLWWLTDQDYINERQEEVDQLLDKTRLEMHAAVQSGSPPPKTLNAPSTTQQLKSGSDSVQNSATLLPCQVKGKRREWVDQGSEPVKRERSSKIDEGDFSYFRQESMLKSQIAKITEKGGLISSEGVEKLVQLMQPDRSENRIDLSGRRMLADVIAATDRIDCLVQFVQLKGLPVLDEWLQEVHKGKIGDACCPKENDKSVDEFILALFRALDKLPVNLNALQSCHVGKSVNNLRGHKNLEIQKKARSLVDTWKKRVDAEMKINDAKSGSTQAVSWPNKPGFSEVSHGGGKRTAASSEAAIKSSVTPTSASKATPVKVGQGDAAVKPILASPGSMKSGSFGVNPKDPNSKMAFGGGPSDTLLTTREEKSSSSSQSQNNSQSCPSEHAKTFSSLGKDEAKSSTTGSMTVNKISSGTSRHRKSSNGYVGSAVSGIQKETGISKCGSMNRNLTSEKVSQCGSACERGPDSSLVDHGNNHRLIVRLPNPGRSPARSGSGGSNEDTSIMDSRASSPGYSEKHDHDQKVKAKTDTFQENIVSEMNTDSCQRNDAKDGVAVSDEGDRSPAAVLDEEHCKTADDSGKLVETSQVTFSSPESDSKVGKSYDSSFNSINAFIESCVKYSEASASMSGGDDIGMNLLASVAAGEMSKSDVALPIDSLRGSSPILEDSVMHNDGNLESSHEEIVAQIQGESDNGAGGATENQGNIVSSQVKDGLDLTVHVVSSSLGDDRGTSYLSEERKEEYSEDMHCSGVELQQVADPCLKYSGEANEITASTSGVLTTLETKDGDSESEGTKQVCERKTYANTGGQNVKSPSFDDIEKVDPADKRITESGIPLVPDTDRGSIGDTCNNDNAVLGVKVEKEVVEEDASRPSLEINCEKKVTAQEGLDDSISTEQKSPLSKSHLESLEGYGEDAVLPSASANVLGAGNVKEFKAERTDDMEAGSHVEFSEKQSELESCIAMVGDEQGGTGLCTSVPDNNHVGFEENTARKDESLEHQSCRSTPHPESLGSPPCETGQCMKSAGSKLIGVEANETEPCVSTVDASSLSVVAGSDVAAKVDFDLNEGFAVDDGNQGEPANLESLRCSSAVHMPSPMSFPVSSMSGGIRASITVAAAAKGAFVPPENILRSKGELGWKGSAATSAFRPAEPRKVPEMPLSTVDTRPPGIGAGKQRHAGLNIDLNVPDERFVEDMASQSFAQETGSEAGLIKNHDGACGEMIGSAAARGRSAGGLDLDLNKVDEDTDVGQFPASTCQRLDVHLLPVSCSSSGGFPNGEVNALRDFDLNNGPIVDEMGTEAAPRSRHAKSSMPFLSTIAGVRVNNTELGSLSSWFPPGNSYSAVTIPSILPDRGEQHYPFIATAGSQRILGPPPGGPSFGPDVYRGPVLSSSPAAAFSPFQYTGFPYGTSFPLPSTSFSGISNAYDSSSGGALCFPAVHSPLVGPSDAISSQYPRPYVISLSDGTSNGVTESSRKWVRQGLDLNAGPGGTDIEVREDRISSTSRQLCVVGSQALSEEQARMYQAAGVLKRKEPEGGWDADRFSYKQPSWP